MKKNKPEVKVHAVMPSEPFHGLEGMKHIPSSIRPGIYDDLVHVPLLLLGYGINNQKNISQQVRLIDLFPTIMFLS